MLWRSTRNQVIAQLADSLTVFFSIAASYYLWSFLKRVYPTLPIGSEITLGYGHFIIIVIAVVVWFILFSAQKAYSYQRYTSLATELKVVLKTVLLGALILLGAIFLLRIGYIPRTLVLLFAILNLVFLTLDKILLFGAAKIIRQLGRNRKTVLVIGTRENRNRFVETIQKNFNWGLDIVGFLDAKRENVGKQILGRKILGTYSDITSVLHSQPFEEVIIAFQPGNLVN